MRKRSLVSACFTLLLSILLISTFKTEVFAQTTPKIAIVSLEHAPFVEGDKNQFYISAKEYIGQVQYQLFYIQESVMKDWKLIDNEDMTNGWTRPIDAQTPIIVDTSSLNLKADKYRFAIRVRRVGVTGLKQNKYGDYDDSYPFNVEVAKIANIELSGNINIEKTNFTNNENLVINGVGNSSNDIQYKLHLFDVKNSKWLTNLTEYNTNVNYNLENIPEGTYIVDLWAKNIKSKDKYDGWKLKTITIQNSLDKGEVINFPDANLEKAIRTAIEKPNGNILKSDVQGIEKIDASWMNIKNLSGIENLTNLTSIDLEGNEISDINVLKGLTNLTFIRLESNQISDISALRGLTNLTIIQLNRNKISDISSLKGLTNLTYIGLSSNEISDISALKELTNLTIIELIHNKISDINVLKGLTNLTGVDLSDNQISDISALKGLTNLTIIQLNRSQISDISSLKGLTNLTQLGLRDNQISDISALKGLVNLTGIYLNNNQISDVSVLEGLTNLLNSDISNNPISSTNEEKKQDNILKELKFGESYGISGVSGFLNEERVTIKIRNDMKLELEYSGNSGYKILGSYGTLDFVEENIWKGYLFDNHVEYEYATVTLLENKIILETLYSGTYCETIEQLENVDKNSLSKKRLELGKQL